MSFGSSQTHFSLSDSGWACDFVPGLPLRITSPVMSSVSRAPQNFSNLVTRSNPLWLMYNRIVLTWLNTNLHNRKNRDAPAGTEAPFTVIEYITRYSRCLRVRRYQEMLHQGNAMKFQDEMGCEQERCSLPNVKEGNIRELAVLSSSVA